jgi:WhiB family redox-sensing transcriptional regulator
VRAECAAHALAAKEPYGVWGGFTETERLRLLTSGWEDTADRGLGRVDVRRLEARLGLPTRMTPPTHPPQRRRPGYRPSLGRMPMKVR